MPKIELRCTGAAACASVTGGPITSGMKGVTVAVTLSADWDGLTPRLVASCGAVCKPMMISASGDALVPWECCLAGRELRLAIDGLAPDGSVRIPTVWASVCRVAPSAADAKLYTEEPTPDIVNQILTAAMEAELAAQSVRDDADAGKFNGKTPIILENGNWAIWVTGQYIDTGVSSTGEIDEATVAKLIEEYLRAHPVAAPVQSVNGKTGAVQLTAKDVSALPDDTHIPDDVTEQTVTGWGFAKTSDVPPAVSDDRIREVISGVGYALDSDLQLVAKSGKYSDLEGKPTIPTSATVSGWGFAQTSDIPPAVTDNHINDLIDAKLEPVATSLSALADRAEEVSA